jgi:predicted Zn-dependent protease
MSPTTSDLDALRQRVREEPGSRYFLRLAEELMRAGERQEALGVLDAGLAARPGHVAATVAKARCLLDLERPADAWSLLEPILARDPTHLVAAKLAVEVWLARRDAVRARESLGRYAPFGAADPDLARLFARVGELEAVPPASADERVATPATAPVTAPAAGGAPSRPASAASGAARAPTPASGSAPAAPGPAPAARDSERGELEDTDELVTVTLGNLYLLQGHRREAERIFRRLLRDDPDDARARQGLARALGSSPPSGRQDV